MHKDQVNMYTTLKNPNITFDSSIISSHVMFSSLLMPDLCGTFWWNAIVYQTLFYGVFNASGTVLLTGYPISRDIDKIWDFRTHQDWEGVAKWVGMTQNIQ